MMDSRKFTLEELSKFDGKESRPAYVAYNGKVYDVTEANLWSDGNHMGEHDAGKDLTQGMEASPHGNSVVENMKIVGELI
jgi:predicted heme/steroid binding protein